MDASHLADLHVQRMSLWLLNVDSEMEIFPGALDSFQGTSKNQQANAIYPNLS